ncbi:MAG: hypothetical protein LC117_10295 [Bacteroidia bacterium]|nr:SGNH/GDSL hydrolase family protein [Bacteroidia bacterium]MCZ2278305.1 hypothetical protein [Bacteroidia bacterium]
MNKLLLLGILIIWLYGCSTAIEMPAPSAGNADFSRYVALGTSFTAGVTDGALFTAGQANSLPAILATAFAEAGGGNFKQPVVNSTIGINLEGKSKLKLIYKDICSQGKGYITQYETPEGDLSIFSDNVSSQGPFNNLGVPGTKSFNFNDQFFGNPTLGNPFYARFAKIPGTSTLLSEAVSLNPTFFTLLIGQEDIYDYALGGGSESNFDSITSIAYFSQNVDMIANTLVNTGAKGAVANIPDPADIPFFTTIPFNGLVLTQQQANTLNNFFVNDTSIHFSAGNNPFLLRDTTALSGVRMLKEGECVLLSADYDSICAGYGSFNFSTNTAWGFRDRHVLDENELNFIRGRVTVFNTKLKTVCDINDLAYVDLYGLFRQLNSGITYSGVRFSNKYVTGKTYSNDGFTLTAQGYAIVANYFISSINGHYSSTLRKVDVLAYPSIIIP